MRQIVNYTRWLFTLAVIALLAGCAGDKAPNITVTGLMDASHQINFATPNKPVLVTFWATTCPSCVEEIPGLIALKQHFGDKIEIVGVAMDYDDPAQLRAFATQRKLPYLVVHDNTQQIARSFGSIFVTPTNILLSPQGEILSKNVGTPDFTALTARINTLLPPA
jgi:thiol-disulfide isomerase/thioredoxin